MDEVIQLSKDLSIRTYPFSDYITCVEVYLNGESCYTFCSDTVYIEELKSEQDLMIGYIQKHLLK